MCQQATCKTCGKVTWRGCGQHVDQVMRGVPAHDAEKVKPQMITMETP